MATIQIPVLFDMSGDTLVFGEEVSGDFVSSHLDFLLDMTTEANDISLNAADISSAILVGDQDSGDNIFYSGGSSSNIAVDNLCNRIAKAITRGKLVHIPKTGNSSNSGIPMGGRLYVVKADGQQELPPDGQYAEKYPHSISPIGDEKMLGEAMASVASVHLMGTPLAAGILVNKDSVQSDLETASGQTFNSGNTAFYNALAVQLSKVLGGSKSSAPMNNALAATQQYIPGDLPTNVFYENFETDFSTYTGYNDNRFGGERSTDQAKSGTHSLFIAPTSNLPYYHVDSTTGAMWGHDANHDDLYAFSIALRGKDGETIGETGFGNDTGGAFLFDGLYQGGGLDTSAIYDVKHHEEFETDYSINGGADFADFSRSTEWFSYSYSGKRAGNGGHFYHATTTTTPALPNGLNNCMGIGFAIRAPNGLGSTDDKVLFHGFKNRGTATETEVKIWIRGDATPANRKISFFRKYAGNYSNQPAAHTIWLGNTEYSKDTALSTGNDVIVYDADPSLFEGNHGGIRGFKPIFIKMNGPSIDEIFLLGDKDDTPSARCEDVEIDFFNLLHSTNGTSVIDAQITDGTNGFNNAGNGSLNGGSSKILFKSGGNSTDRNLQIQCTLLWNGTLNAQHAKIQKVLWDAVEITPTSTNTTTGTKEYPITAAALEDGNWHNLTIKFNGLSLDEFYLLSERTANTRATLQNVYVDEFRMIQNNWTALADGQLLDLANYGAGREQIDAGFIHAFDASGTSVPALKSIYEQLMNVPGRSQIMESRDVSGVVDNSNVTLAGGFPFISGDKIVLYLRPRIVFAAQTQAESNNALYAFNYTGSAYMSVPAYNIADKNGDITGQTYSQSSSQNNTMFIFEKATTGAGVAGNEYFTSAGGTYNNSTGVHEGANANGTTANVDVGTPPPANTITHIITVGDNGGNKFKIDGAFNPILTFVKGNTYIFDQSDATNSGHQIQISETSAGGNTSYATTVGTPGTAGAKTTVVVPTNAPGALYYNCNPHGAGMGNSISVTSPTNSIDGEWGQVDIGESSWATELQLTTNNSYNDRSPREFRLLGSTDGTNWKTLIHQTQAGPWVDSTPQTFTISNPTSYRYYRYVVIKCYNAVNGGNIDARTSIGHFNLRGVKYPSEVIEVTNAGLMNGSPLDISGLQTNVVASSASIQDAFPGNATSGPEAETSKWGWMGSANSDSLSLDTTDVTDPRTIDLHIWKITITL